ncbi:IclR family transcriptional regulator [Halorubrum sp. C191]|uniref:IclR family transcriptional regulator n=1 Tax=Halorubrum sp. C191 TaxID=1383842 RepID=UPI000C0773F0|nr:IclR family transcriptional regulator [Halorubrum sp. C191]PHQ41585.1 IclR family transcriptional regulator [Halorubrum sp. C191]
MTFEPEDTDGQTIGSVGKALDIVELVRELEPVGVTELATELGRSKSSIHHYLATLAERGYLERDDNKYTLGLRFLTFGGTAREREHLFQLGKADADDLGDETGEKVRLIVERDGYGITLYQTTGDRVEETYTHVGSTEELYCTAAGKAFLASVPQRELDDYIGEKNLRSRTANTITSETDLRAELDRIRSSGIAFDDREYYEDVRCVASPITRSDGSLVGMFSVSAPIDRMPENRFRGEIPNKIQNTVTVVEINTTYSGWTDSGS